MSPVSIMYSLTQNYVLCFHTISRSDMICCSSTRSVWYLQSLWVSKITMCILKCKKFISVFKNFGFYKIVFCI